MPQPAVRTGADAYSDKSSSYFTGERRDFIDRLSPSDDREILEIGCGDGATGAYAKLTGRCGRYVGLELSPDAAELARGRLDQVFVGDVEAMKFPFEIAAFDVLIASEVLEHLVDPWSTLRRLRRYMKPGARVFASSPNVAHRSTLVMLLNGRWDLTDDGRMDRTHLRWFTPSSFADMFRQSGYEVVSLEPLRRPGPLARAIDVITGRRFSHLFISQIVVEARAI